jgi:hypothetical protein
MSRDVFPINQGMDRREGRIREREREREKGGNDEEENNDVKAIKQQEEKC